MSEPAAITLEPETTPALATRMLPLVARIAHDLQRAWRAWREAVEAYELRALHDGSDTDGARDALGHVERCAADVEALRRELHPLGATCPSPRTARIEWRTVIDGAPGRLVWYPDDAEVRRWVPGDEPASALRIIPGLERPEDLESPDLAR
ncbi:MAG: DUF2203 family protein [Gemmatimonadaceae bacterium]|jgi:hypothetical protein|nr:DUF2203 family protein [Gemmatimonadaceae bacterium]